ncbi:aminoacyl-tRNA hydrolase [Paucilactobacillus suebicus]|uniref:Peptidyl-tRNA hydrolase n=1 Tax=Paucilactobacillus suebicus DSM 5007 = KCTC 3549 TaxID=1423807 RepID=A0A0R1VW74_9LACO|nr:aminoacyl-tRNA hydrolase [Paucilactobacillus suebicus]KRM09746.1 peptidyl-tRNA hydrolase [Paucilactobacillus suebicus DSM 5007 = KCTC 3549]
MKMIVGLGNIGPQYDETRHNTGFMVVDRLAVDNQLSFKHVSKMEAMLASGMINGEKVLLVKPTTFMNDSGRSVRPLVDYYDLDISDLVIVHDDMDLPVGKIRLKKKGSAGGHNGIKSLISYLGTQHFNRVKVGIDHPNKQSVVNYVLGKFKPDQKEAFEQAKISAVSSIEEWVSGKNFDQLMNEFN